MTNEVIREEVYEEVLESADGSIRVEETFKGWTRLGLAMYYYTVYDGDGNVIGEAEDLENSAGGCERHDYWGPEGLVY